MPRTRKLQRLRLRKRHRLQSLAPKDRPMLRSIRVRPPLTRRGAKLQRHRLKLRRMMRQPPVKEVRVTPRRVNNLPKPLQSRLIWELAPRRKPWALRCRFKAIGSPD